MAMDKFSPLMLPLTDTWAEAIAEALGQPFPSPEGAYLNGDLMYAISYLGSCFNHLVVTSDSLKKMDTGHDMTSLVDSVMDEICDLRENMLRLLSCSTVIEE